MLFGAFFIGGNNMILDFESVDATKVKILRDDLAAVQIQLETVHAIEEYLTEVE